MCEGSAVSPALGNTRNRKPKLVTAATRRELKTNHNFFAGEVCDNGHDRFVIVGASCVHHTLPWLLGLLWTHRTEGRKKWNGGE